MNQPQHPEYNERVSRRFEELCEILLSEPARHPDPDFVARIHAEFADVLPNRAQLLACPDPSPPSGAASPAPRAADVLLADRDAAFLEVLAEFLLAAGYSTCTARDPDDAWKHFQYHRFRAVITNYGPYHTPYGQMSGLDLAARVKARCSHVPVIMLSAHPPAAAAAYCDVVLTKTIASLADVLGELRALGIDPTAQRPTR